MIDHTRRKEGIQRIQVGLAGLTGVVLLVGLAHIVVDNVKREEVVLDAGDNLNANASVAAATEQKPPEPLAELGVAPAPEVTTQSPVVADLQPDPNLKQPMDRPAPVGPVRSDAPAGEDSQAR